MNVFGNLHFEMGKNLCVAFRKTTPQYFAVFAVKGGRGVLGGKRELLVLLKLLVLL